MESYKYEVKTPVIREILINLAEKSKREPRNKSEIDNTPFNYRYFYIDWKGFNYGFTSIDASLCNTLDLEEMIEKINTPPKNLFKLNDKYTAEIKQNGDIQVDCQTIPGEVVIKLSKEIQKILDKKA